METLKAKTSKSNGCEFMAFSCKGGLPSFENGHCFPQIHNLGEKSLNVSYRRDIGRMGENAIGEGVLYFVTRDSAPFCGKNFVDHQNIAINSLLRCKGNL